MGEWIKILGVGGFVLFFVIITFFNENKQEIKTENSKMDKEMLLQSKLVLIDSISMAKAFKDEEKAILLKEQLVLIDKNIEKIEIEETEKLKKLKQAEANSEKLMKDAEKEYNKLNSNEENK